MMIPARPPGTNAEDGAAPSERPAADTPDSPPPPPAASVAALPALAYAEFAAAVKNALRDFHRPDLLARNPLLRDGIFNFSGAAGPQELKAFLAETVSTLFGNTRDEKLRRVIELTYFQPSLKQEAVADRLSLPFGTYRRHLTNTRDRLALWLWESSRVAPVQSDGSAAVEPQANEEGTAAKAAVSPEGGEPTTPRLSVVVLPFVNIVGCAQDDPSSTASPKY